MLNFRVDEVPESTFKSLSNKSKMSVLSTRNQHFRYWGQPFTLYIPSLWNKVWGPPPSLRSALLNTWKFLKDQCNAWFRSWHILWLGGNSNAPPCSACLYAGTHPLANCTARPSMQVLEHTLVGWTELPRLLQVEHLCSKSRVCSTAKAQQCKGRTVCAISVCAAN